MLETRRASARMRRWSFAVAGAALVHALIYAAMIERVPTPPSPPPAFEVTLERPPERETPPPPQRSPLAQARPPAPAARPSAAPAPLAPPPAVEPAPSPRPTRQASRPAGGQGEAPAPLKLGCVGTALKGKAREDCDREAYQAYMARPRDERPEYAAVGPQGFKPPAPRPGIHYTPPFGFRIEKSANDKHFIPFVFGDSKTTVIDRQEVAPSDLPKPLQ